MKHLKTFFFFTLVLSASLNARTEVQNPAQVNVNAQPLVAALHNLQLDPGAIAQGINAVPVRAFMEVTRDLTLVIDVTVDAQGRIVHCNVKEIIDKPLREVRSFYDFSLENGYYLVFSGAINMVKGAATMVTGVVIVGGNVAKEVAIQSFEYSLDLAKTAHRLVMRKQNQVAPD